MAVHQNNSRDGCAARKNSDNWMLARFFFWKKLTVSLFPKFELKSHRFKQKNVVVYRLLLLKKSCARISEAYVNTGDYLINGHCFKGSY
jgi:hypothetical protein